MKEKSLPAIPLAFEFSKMAKEFRAFLIIILAEFSFGKYST